MMEDLYWIWLSESLRTGSKKIKEIYNVYKSAKCFYESSVNEWKLFGIFTIKEINRLSSYNLNDAEKIIARCKFLGMDIITIQDSRYPERLRNIANPPAVLYVKGTLPNIDERICIAMVGTRSATLYGTNMAFDLAFSLTKLGAVVISGGAVGIDTAAHKGALHAEGETVLVMGCGLNHKYLMENANMRNQIAEHGAIVSEYPPDLSARIYSFPLRNRIISGLSNGTVIVEAGIKSGSLITANLTLEQNRDLFAVPGNITSEYSKGTNNLLKDCAKPVTSAMDIMEEYLPAISRDELNDFEKKLNQTISQDEFNNLSAIGKKLYKALSRSPQHVDTIAQKLGVAVSDLLIGITELEIVGLLKQFPGRMYAKTR